MGRGAENNGQGKATSMSVNFKPGYPVKALHLKAAAEKERTMKNLVKGKV